MTPIVYGSFGPPDLRDGQETLQDDVGASGDLGKAHDPCPWCAATSPESPALVAIVTDGSKPPATPFFLLNFLSSSSSSSFLALHPQPRGHNPESRTPHGCPGLASLLG